MTAGENKRKEAIRMKVAVVGGGKVGYYLAKTLIEHGHEPTLIERDEQTCAYIANDLDIPTFCGDGTTIEALESADVAHCDAFVCVTGKDEDNLIAGQLVKKRYGVKRVVAKANNPRNLAVMKQLGIDIVVSSTDNIVRLIEREVDTSAIKQLLSINQGEASISEILLPDHYKLDGKTLSEIRFPEDAIVISIIRDNHTLIPRGNTQLNSRDKILVLSTNKALSALKSALKLPDYIVI